MKKKTASARTTLAFALGALLVIVLLGQSWALNAVQSLWPGVKPMPGGFFCIPR